MICKSQVCKDMFIIDPSQTIINLDICIFTSYEVFGTLKYFTEELYTIWIERYANMGFKDKLDIIKCAYSNKLITKYHNFSDCMLTDNVQTKSSNISMTGRIRAYNKLLSTFTFSNLFSFQIIFYYM